MGLSTWGWGVSCGGLITSGGWGECPCPDFIPGIDLDICGVNIKSCVDVRARPGELASRTRPGELASRARPANIPSRSTICED